MATQRRFEGNTLTEVLAKVQQEVGTDAQIASAQKVRSGGAFGFFQKERFEVLVDVPERSAARRPAPTAPSIPASSTFEIAEDDDDTLTPASLLELAQQISREERNNESAAPAMSTESDVFADVLSRMAFQADMDGETEKPVTPTVVPPTAKPASVFEALLAEDTPVLEAAPTPVAKATPILQPDPATIEPPAAPASFIPGRPSFLDEPAAIDPGAPPLSPVLNDVPAPSSLHHSGHSGPSAPEDAVLLEPMQQSPIPEPAVREIIIDEPIAVEPIVAEPVFPEAHVLPSLVEPEPTPVPVPAARTRITDHPLAKLGLPGAFIPHDVDAIDLRAALTETLEERLPQMPVIRPSRGSIIAIVGDREEAVRVATDIAREFGRPNEEIVVASQHVKGKMADNVLRTVENAEDAQRSWSRRNRPTIVAIEAYPGSRDTSWAEHVLTALEPIATFGVLDATRKAEDVAAWADALGGIDCLAVNNIEETVSPAAVLHAGIPVERIDGRKATPEYWALLLTERLSAA